MYEPTPPQSHEVGSHLVGPISVYDRCALKEIWMYFDFSRGTVVVVQDPKTDDWDLAFQRYVIKTNGGDTNPWPDSALLGLWRSRILPV